MSAVLSEEFLSLKSTESATARKSGRAVRDERGESVWEWQVETGVFKRDVTDEQLRRLEAPDLSIVEFSAKNPGSAIGHGSSSSVLERVSRRVPVTRPTASGSTLGSLWAKLRR